MSKPLLYNNGYYNEWEYPELDDEFVPPIPPILDDNREYIQEQVHEVNPE